ncbi:OmpH family outer membrane protein [Leptobacterium flavescens]|uniref:OmpH family outer membrane protein n=1 Tax=Leptobacterium flavescens TaxID=472055 RepID=A0A6P0UMH4_9FLAO|nr:OmpH family outer membrane protein [Leptobacterium flavescens]NER14217.1 OmpH family outer membrane protein [Leptobacterium flavescens]
MKKIVLGILMTASLISCQQEKNAFIHNTTLINDYEERKEIEAKFKKKVEAFQKKTDSLSQLFQIEATEFQNQAAKLPQQKAQERYNELLQKQQFMQQQLGLEERQIQQESQTEIDSLISKVRRFIKDYGKKNGYTYIWGANEAGSVLYGQEGKDITQEVLKALNDSYKK